MKVWIRAAMRWAAALACLSLIRAAHAEEVNFDSGWMFAKGDIAGAETVAGAEADWQKIDLPHDWAISGTFDRNALSTGSGGWLPTGVVWYRKSFALPAADRGKRVFVEFGGIMDTPPSIAPTFFQLDVFGALGVGIVQVVLVFVLVEVFDATGTLIGVAKRAGLLAEGPGHTSPALGRALMADSSAIVAGSMLGTSSTTAYVESASGVQAGGRTGLTALTVAVLFLLALFFAPLAGTVPAFATALLGLRPRPTGYFARLASVGPSGASVAA